MAKRKLLQQVFDEKLCVCKKKSFPEDECFGNVKKHADYCEVFKTMKNEKRPRITSYFVSKTKHNSEGGSRGATVESESESETVQPPEVDLNIQIAVRF